MYCSVSYSSTVPAAARGVDAEAGGRQERSSSPLGQLGAPSHSSSVSMQAIERFWLWLWRPEAATAAAAGGAEAAAPHRNFVYVNGHSRRTGALPTDTLTPADDTRTACRGNTYVSDLHASHVVRRRESRYLSESALDRIAFASL